ncbi:MAG: hotdog fold thioesterase [Gammaproteobacteria bacterium]|nr:hotdog fold thioesterase [Gammaproteobacteria bacterium]MDP2348213.1 hotdog fold thioesterase [Gammaproteobacteria bacterium]
MTTTPVWTRPITLEQTNAHAQNTAVSNMGIELTEVGDDYLTGRMPVDHRTVQPYGILHGGSSVLLAETLGSIAANHCVRGENQRAVGLEINANHLRAVASGWVTGTARPIHIGGSTQVWEIRIVNEEGKPTCISRITMAVITVK